MNRDNNSSKINDPNSGEKSIKDKKGQGHVPKTGEMTGAKTGKKTGEKTGEKTGGKTGEKNAENQTKEVFETTMELDSPHFDGKSLNAKPSSSIQIFDYSMVTSRSGVSGSQRFIDDRDTKPTTEYSINTEVNETSSNMAILECPTPRDSPIYNINLPRRGKCVIFNHEIFDPGNGLPRFGTDLDVKAIKHTFLTLGFEIVVHQDLQWYKVSEEITKLSQEDYTDCGCICIFLLTHGDAGGRLSAKDASYPFISIWRPFTADNCATLFGKPKMFFTQACRGGQYDEPIRGRSQTDFNDQSYTLPSQADFLFGYSTLDGFYSIRETQKGSWYIQTLCDVINKHWMSLDLVKMLTITSRRVGMEKSSALNISYLNEKKQMPTITSTLTRDIVFSTKSC